MNYQVKPQIFYICRSYLFIHTYNLLNISNLADLICMTSFWIVHTSVYLQKTNTYKVLSRQPQTFYISKPYSFLHIYDPF